MGAGIVAFYDWAGFGPGGIVYQMRVVKTSLLLTMFFALAFRCIPGYCAGISVGDGASFGVGNAQIDVNCLDLVTAGQLDLDAGSFVGVDTVSISSTGQLTGGNGSLELSGDWQNAGVFVPSHSNIKIQDGCGLNESVLIGDNDFSAFSVTTSSGKTLSVEAGSLQTFSDNLSLQGAAPNGRLRIRSSVGGQSAYFVLFEQGAQQILAVDVRDNDATGGQLLAPGLPEGIASVDAGNNKNWFGVLTDLIFKDGFETK